jgi:hypothetical protein
LAFNIYIDDIFKVSSETLAYADELAIVCKNKNELDNLIDLLEIWAVDYEI